MGWGGRWEAHAVAGSDWRLEVIREMYEEGSSLAEIGEYLDLSGERVRQVLPRAGVKPRSPQETRRIRRAEQLQRRDEILAAFKQTGDAGRVARDLDVQMSVVKEVVATLPRASAYRRRAYETRFNDDELLARLRRAARANGSPLAVSAFNAYAEGRTRRGKPWPKHPTYLKRFGSWSAALQAAGLPARPSSPMNGRRRYSEDDCLRAIKKVARQVRSVPTAAQYELAAMGSKHLPSLGTIRTRFGSWRLGLERAGLL